MARRVRPIVKRSIVTRKHAKITVGTDGTEQMKNGSWYSDCNGEKESNKIRVSAQNLQLTTVTVKQNGRRSKI